MNKKVLRRWVHVGVVALGMASMTCQRKDAEPAQTTVQTSSATARELAEALFPPDPSQSAHTFIPALPNYRSNSPTNATATPRCWDEIEADSGWDSEFLGANEREAIQARQVTTLNQLMSSPSAEASELATKIAQTCGRLETKIHQLWCVSREAAKITDDLFKTVSASNEPMPFGSYCASAAGLYIVAIKKMQEQQLLPGVTPQVKALYGVGKQFTDTGAAFSHTYVLVTFNTVAGATWQYMIWPGMHDAFIPYDRGTCDYHRNRGLKQWPAELNEVLSQRG